MGETPAPAWRAHMKRAALIITLASVAIWAVLAVVALLGAGFGDTQWKIVTSSMLVTGGAIIAMGCATPLHSGRLGLLPYVGIAASVGGFGLMTLGVWADFSWDAAFKAAISLVIVAVAIGAIGLIDAARLHARHQWLVATTQTLVGFAGALLITAVWGEIDNEMFWRLTGVVLVLTAAAVVAVPILHRLADIPPDAAPAAQAVAACPFCARELHGPLASRITCGECGRSFRVLP